MSRDPLLRWAFPAAVLVLGVGVGLLATVVPEASRAISLFSPLAVGIVLWLWHRAKGGEEGRWFRDALVVALAYRICMALLHLMVGLWVFGGALDFRFFHELGVERGWDIVTGRWEGLLPFEWDWTVGTFFVSDLHGLFYLLVGSSLVGMFLMSGVVGFFAAYFFFRAFQIEFPHALREHRFLFLAVFFLPSMAYWTGLLGKDSWIVFFLGLATLTVSHLSGKVRLRHAAGLLIGVVGAALIRPPVGVAAALAAGAALLLVRGGTGPAALLRPVRLGATALLAVGGVVYLSRFVVALNPEFARSMAQGQLLENLAESVVLRNMALRGDLGVEIGSVAAGQVIEEGVEGVARSLPMAMVSFLFRPVIFEVRQPLELLAALEMTALIIFLLWRWQSVAAVLRSLFTRPAVAFCAMMALLLTAGLSHEASFGVIVRHRTMVLPFLLWLLAVPAWLRCTRPSLVEGDGARLAEAPVGER